jgi:predicted O-linked N-acetylglucosamine transferase (SPINDLY family)
MSQHLSAAMAAGRIAEAATLAFAQAGMGVLPITELFGLAGLLDGQGKPEQAIALYQLWLKHTESSLLYAAWYNLAVLQAQSGDEPGAEHAFHQSIDLKPDFTEARLGLGNLLERSRRPDAALAIWREALELIDAEAPGVAPLQIKLLNNLGRVGAQQLRHHEAEEALAHSLQLDPRQPAVIAQWVQLRQQQCAWPVFAPMPGLDEAALLDAAGPSAMLYALDDPARQLAAARRHVREQVLGGLAVLSHPGGYAHRRLRVGYLCADFGAAPAAALSAELYALHDRGLVEVYGFCWSREDGARLRARVMRGLDHYEPLGGLTDLQAAQLIRSHEIDILVDLQGLAAGARAGILSYRPAPVQIAWLGYAGSTALPGIDHVLADAFVLPPAVAQHFTETPLYLPHSFQIADRQRQLGPRVRRSTCGLSAEAFVFCAFQSGSQLNPAQFSSWMRILQRVPDSVLWLAADNEPLRDNLRVAALRHGVASERVVFAAHAPADGQLARYRLADLMLDTSPCNASQIASDALWAGLPVLTHAGNSFAARTVGSLLHAAGLPELVAHSVREYEDLAVRLAQTPARLASLRRRLKRERDRCALFDTPRFVRNLEQLYQRVAHGVLLREPATAGTAAASADDGNDSGTADKASTLPLISILIPAADLAPTATANAPAAAGKARASGAMPAVPPSAAVLALEGTLRSALAQTHGHVEIIISDSSEGYAIRDLVASFARKHPQLRYSRAPGLSAEANLNHCLALALGDFIAVTPQGDTLHPEKLARMLDLYQRYPHLGLVASWRAPLAASGAPLPVQPPFHVQTGIGGVSLGQLLLTADNGPLLALCHPAGLLLRRSAIGASFGAWQGRQYRRLGEVAGALAALAGRDCLYLPDALTAYTVQPEAPLTPAEALERSLEGLQLLYDAHARQLFQSDPARLRQALSARLSALAALLTAHHSVLSNDPNTRLDEIQSTMRQGYQLLLSAG